MFSLLLMLKRFFLFILIMIDFSLYFIPIFLLCFIPNFLITLIWFFPSIFQLCSFILINKEWDLRIKIYLFLISPIIILLYLLIGIGTYVYYRILITLIFPLITIIQRPEYSLHSLSSIATLISLTRLASNESLPDSSWLKLFEEVGTFRSE